MANPRALVKRRKAVQNTRKITKTMEMVSTARFAKAQQQALSSRPYAEHLQRIIGDLASVTEISHPLLDIHHPIRRASVLLFTSDRGLCGGFNAHLIDLALEAKKEIEGRKAEAEFIAHGKKGAAAFKFLKIPLASSFLGLSAKPDYGRAEAIGNELIRRYQAREIDEVYVVYSRFRSITSQKAVLEKILPLAGLKKEPKGPKEGGKRKAPGAGYLFHPGPEAILSQVLPLVVKMSIFTAMLDNTAGEHAARRLAMKNATDAADEMIKFLTRSYNRARQGKITQEIAEIVGGAEAL
jgi:F-type H+-transporting ATPase subunit gamma